MRQLAANRSARLPFYLAEYRPKRTANREAFDRLVMAYRTRMIEEITRAPFADAEHQCDRDALSWFDKEVAKLQGDG